MADQEYEEFCKHLDLLPQHFKAPAQTYKLVHAITPMEESKSFLEKVQMGGKLCGLNNDDRFFAPFFSTSGHSTKSSKHSSHKSNHNHNNKDRFSNSESDDDDVIVTSSASRRIGNGKIEWTEKPQATKKTIRRNKLLPSFTSKNLRPVNEEEYHHLPKRWTPTEKRKQINQTSVSKGPTSLMDELFEAESKNLTQETLTPTPAPRPTTSSVTSSSSAAALTLNFEKVDDIDVDGPGDVDSGNSTNHSPDDAQRNLLTTSTTEVDFPTSPSLLSTKLDLLDPTHRGLHRFVPRHNDEIEIDIGDPVYVQKEAEDLWCEGANLRTGQQGIFPIAHVVDVDYNDFDPNGLNDDRKERYLLEYLGSVESSLYKGNVVLCQAVRKILQSSVAPRPHPTVLEISDKGIKMIDKNKSKFSSSPCHDYFYSLKNVTFCGFHPFDPKYFGFVSKHPRLPKYACHVFVGERSTQPVAEACGRAFQRFYQKFIDTAFPVEDIYLE